MPLEQFAHTQPIFQGQLNQKLEYWDLETLHSLLGSTEDSLLGSTKDGLREAQGICSQEQDLCTLGGARRAVWPCL